MTRLTEVRVDYDQLIDEFSVHLGTADEIDATQLLDDLHVGFDHAREGRLLTVIALSPAIGKSRGWQEVFRELIGDTLWRAYEEAEREGLPVQGLTHELPAPEAKALLEGPWRLHHRRLRLELGIPVDPVPEATRQSGHLRLGYIKPAGEERALGDEPQPGTEPGSSKEIGVDFGDLSTYGYGPRATLTWTASDRLTVKLTVASDHPKPLRIRVAQPAGVEGEAEVLPPRPDSYWVEVDIAVHPGIPTEQLPNVRVVAGPPDA